MRPLRFVFDRLEPLFAEGGKLEKLYPLFEATESFFYTPSKPTSGSCHVRDAIDFKRMMMIVVIAVMPCTLMAMYNTGLQANRYMQDQGISTAAGWRGEVLDQIGIGYDPANIAACFLHGALFFLPVYIVCMVVGGGWEVLFSIVRRHEVNEGFFVTGILFPLTLPPTIPLWQVAIGITFGVVIGKEIFGGTGRNFLNPALTARAFLFFAYPTQISGSEVWTAVDGFSGATPLGALAEGGMKAVHDLHVTWSDAFLGTIQGSMGETSVLACLIGVVILLACQVASWRIMLSMLLAFLGAATAAYGLYLSGTTTNPAFEMPPHWHLVVGGLAFGLVFMATDPVSASMTHLGQYVYGALIGVMVILVRVFNTGFPEAVMLAILFGNVFAPLIDFYVVRANIRRRALRHA
ncbi:MAG: NADH:ubiquinone reductase (Na(+)-transporting) subunit B [Pirellulaceae bacterium]|nr:NADH:ubiquinone reductase (Na(+)-transporting) subunit B [Pirellulaceae bacterium]